jgi:hypothetical protein
MILYPLIIRASIDQFASSVANSGEALVISFVGTNIKNEVWPWLDGSSNLYLLLERLSCAAVRKAFLPRRAVNAVAC